jgi:hypothetical protein
MCSLRSGGLDPARCPKRVGSSSHHEESFIRLASTADDRFPVPRVLGWTKGLDDRASCFPPSRQEKGTKTGHGAFGGGERWMVWLHASHPCDKVRRMGGAPSSRLRARKKARKRGTEVLGAERGGWSGFMLPTHATKCVAWMGHPAFALVKAENFPTTGRRVWVRRWMLVP